MERKEKVELEKNLGGCFGGGGFVVADPRRVLSLPWLLSLSRFSFLGRVNFLVFIVFKRNNYVWVS